MRLRGKVAVISGASRGIGRAIAKSFAQEGATVVVGYLQEQEKALQVVDEVCQAGGKGIPLQVDVSRESLVKDFFAQVDESLEMLDVGNGKGIDILVNNAGIGPRKPIEDVDEDFFEKVFSVNIKGTFFMCKHVIPRLRRGGRIINISSALTRINRPEYIVYACTKGAMDVLTQQLAKQLGELKGVTVNSINGGAIDTDLTADWIRTSDAVKFLEQRTALGRVGQPDDLASVATFLASDESRWVTAQKIEVSGGAEI
ncbi:MAG: SDR family NAD(P)-dependent oxidoreductase [Xenococcaceae cyanobacterium]